MNKYLSSLFICVIPITAIIWLLILDIRPAGIREATLVPNHRSPILERPLPGTRVAVEDGAFIVKGDPVYFSVHTPQTTYDEVEIEIEFNIKNQPIVEIGPQVDIFSGAFNLKPFYNEIIEEIDWERHETFGSTLYTKEEIDSADDFFDQEPARYTVGTYHAELQNPYREAGYRSLGRRQSVDMDLRGYHKIVTYIKNEDLLWDFTFTDMNRTLGRDDILLRVVNEQGGILLEKKVEDDGNAREDQEMSKIDMQIEIEDLPEGVYSIEVIVTDDIFIRNISTNQRYVTFVNTLNIGDTIGYREKVNPVSFTTNATVFSLQTLHNESLQTVEIDSHAIEIHETHTQFYEIIDSTGLRTGVIPKGDVTVVGNGKFAFSTSSFFEPDTTPIGPYTDLGNQGIEAILTTYESPRIIDGHYVANQTYDLAAFPAGSDMRFAISAPFIESFEGYVNIYKITARFKKDPIDFKQFLQEALKRLPFGL